MKRKVKTESMREVMDWLTPEKMEEMRQERLGRIKKLSLDFQLGLFVGEYIFYKYLPTLSVDYWKTRNVIDVSPEEKVENDRLNDIWFKKAMVAKDRKSDEDWKAWHDYYKSLEVKYLPHTLDCRVYPLNLSNEEDFKRGVRSALWNSDVCAYKCSTNEDIVIKYDNNGYYTHIILQLSI